MISIMGYPQETKFCPKCGSENIDENNSSHGNGKVKCYDCGCICIIIQGEEE